MNDTSIQQPLYPFLAIVGQEEMKRALILASIDPGIGGVMIMGHRGTGKSTAVRALASIMPPIEVVADSSGNRNPNDPEELWEGLADIDNVDEHPAQTARIPVPVVDLPLGATEDRITGTIDIEQALLHGKKRFEPGLLARANRGFLYIDEVNLLEDHLVDLLLDVAASGVNVVEREGISVRHPARFALVGSGNPEEGELRPQLLDRFGLHASIETESDIDRRVEIIKRRMAFDDNPVEFTSQWEQETDKMQQRIEHAQRSIATVTIPDHLYAVIAGISAELGIDGHRGELVLARGARANAAFEGRDTVTQEDIRTVAPLALRHRLRKDPLQMTDPANRILEVLRTALSDS